MKNREERRAYERKIKNDKRASKCPICGYKSLFYTKAQLKPYDGIKKEFTKDDFDTQICCEVCDSVIYEGEEVSKLVPPGIILPLPLDIFDYALRHPDVVEKAAADDNEVINTEIIEGEN